MESSDLIVLKPCPFCGWEPVTEEVGENGAAEMVECFNNKCPVGPHVSCCGKNEARKKWNTRV